MDSSGYESYPGGMAPNFYGSPEDKNYYYGYEAPMVDRPHIHFQAPPPNQGKKDLGFRPSISWKNQLQEYAQRIGVAMPRYQTTRNPVFEPSWTCVVTFKDIEYRNPVPERSKKGAELSAAKFCLESLGLWHSSDEGVGGGGGEDAAETAPAAGKTPDLTAKARLHHLLTKNKLSPAVFKTVESVSSKGFVSTVEVDGQVFTCEEVSRTKKAAEHLAASVAVAAVEASLTPPAPAVLDADQNGGDVIAVIVSSKCKLLLNEYCMKRQMFGPSYTTETISHEGRPAFRAKVFVGDRRFDSESGKLYRTKKQAELGAASEAWAALKDEALERDAAERATQQQPFKSILQEHLARRDLEPPVYSFERKEGKGYFASCRFEGGSYSTATSYLSKKTAEQEAAKLALEGLGVVNLEKIVARRTIRARRFLKATRVTAASWRAGLDEFLRKNGRKASEAVVEQAGTSGRFVARILLDDSTRYSSEDDVEYPDGDLAVESASRAACRALGVVVGLTATNGQDHKSISEPIVKVVMHDALGREVASPSQGLKRSLLEFQEPRKRMKTMLVPQESWAVPKSILERLIVVEVWPEKRNVVVVGNGSFSCPLLCLNPEKKLEIIAEGRPTPLEPGMVLVNVDAVFKQVSFCGGITLLTNSCERILKVDPSTPPVLTGAGVVVLTKSEMLVKVLLKRYKVSPAFVPVAQELAFAFRRAADVFGSRPKFRRDSSTTRSMRIDVNKVVKNIQRWTNQEVEAVAKMDKASLSSLFALTKWKWMDRWAGVLEGKTAAEMKALFASAKAEKKAKRSAVADIAEDDDDDDDDEPDEDKIEEPTGKTAPETNSLKSDEEDDSVPLKTKYGFAELAERAVDEMRRRGDRMKEEEEETKDWELPRGGFRHQVLSTGIHLESAAECARRELKEECDITLRLKDVEASSTVTVLRTDGDNLNPHKGDATLYFFRQIEPDVARAAGKPIQDLFDISRKPRPLWKRRPRMRASNPPAHFLQLVRQKEIHEAFAWFPLEEAEHLSSLFKYVASTPEFLAFLESMTSMAEVKIEAEVKAEAE